MTRPPTASQNDAGHSSNAADAESTYAWLRMLAALGLSTIGGVGMWSVVVALPTVQAEFSVARGDASLPYTLTMICFGLAGIGMGKLSDRFGIILPVAVGAGALLLGYVLAASATSIWQFALVQGLLIGAGSSARSHPSWPTCRTGSPAAAAWRWASSPAATIYPARHGHP